MDQQLPTQLLPAVPHFVVGIFNIAIPNLIAWILVVVVFFAAMWAGIPRFFERPEPPDHTVDQPDSSEGGRS